MRNGLAEKLRQLATKAGELARAVEAAHVREENRTSLCCEMIPRVRFSLSTITSATLAVQLDFFIKELDKAGAELAANREGRNVRPTVIRRPVVRRR
jgi:hypothetical protein